MLAVDISRNITSPSTSKLNAFSAILFFIGLDVSEIYIQAVEYSIILSAVLLVMAFTMGQHKKVYYS